MKGITVFFPFLAATIIGAGAVKLGAMSAMVSVLSLALQVLILANLFGAAYRPSTASRAVRGSTAGI